MELNSPVESVKGVGEVLKKNLNKLGIYSIADLIDYYPRKYEDYSNVQKISEIKPGMVTLMATIKQVKSRYVRRGINITEAVASDSTGSVRLIWFNQPYRANTLRSDTEYYIRGDFGLRRGRLSIMSPSTELVSDFPINSARIIPVYKLTKGIKSSQIRKIISIVRHQVYGLEETLPDWVVGDNNLITRSEALIKLHFPDEVSDIEKAKNRLGFEEIFQLSLASEMNKMEFQTNESVRIVFDEKLIKDFVSRLSFQLTDSQKRAAWQIFKDIESGRPMNRLLEGDVGSGKTVVACMSALMTANAGFQVAIMAPTEILAKQHFNSFRSLLESVDYQDSVEILVGSTKKTDRQNILDRIKKGQTKILIGTTSLIQELIELQNLALIIIDEQHRFGVDQRKKLQSKSHASPHVLSMTATPIPRSLALTLYGELDITVIDEKPKDRLPIITKLISPNSSKEMYEHVRQEIHNGRQALVVCPVIDASSEVGSSAEQVYESLKNKEFKNLKVGLLHGKLKSDVKESIMESFANNSINVLVSTTVIEVGVDVPNATVIIIMSPERFGLAQIHQLRGRVGRGFHQSYCYIALSDSKAPSRRLNALATKSSGFELAELDLELRGPGAIYGTIQHGSLDLRMANLANVRLIETAKKSAKLFIEKKEKLSKYPHLKDNVVKLRKITNLN